MDEILKLFGGAENIWKAIKENALKVGAESTKMMLELFFVLKSPETGIFDKTLIVTALGYQLLPEDFMPREKYGLLGFLDNVVTVCFAHSKVKSSITPQIENQVNNIMAQWFGDKNNAEHQDCQFGAPVYIEKQQGTESQASSMIVNQNTMWNDDEDVVID